MGAICGSPRYRASRAIVRAACQRLALPVPVQGNVKLFSDEVEGLAVKLPNWDYPAVASLATRQLAFDFNGRSGDQKELDRLLQAYAVEKCRIETRKKGHLVTEQQLANASIKLTVQIGGAA